jgi:hypothetical protein
MSAPARITLIVTVLALALLAPATASGQTQLPVGEAKGVRIVRPHGSVVLIFSPSAARLRERINSRYAWISCTNLDEPFSSTGSGNLDVPRHGRRVRTGFSVEGADFCEIYLRERTIRRPHQTIHLPDRVLVSIPLTQAGAVYLDERKDARAMFVIVGVAAFVKDDEHLPGVLTYAQLVKAYPRLTGRLVELAAPGDSPPPHRIGYFSDGQQHTVLATLSASGRRLYIEQAADEVLSTNVSKYLFGLFAGSR